MKKIVLVACILCFPARAWAWGCDCASIQTMITTAHTQTVQAVNINTTTEAQAVRSEILQAAQNIIGTIKTESATIVQAIVNLKESNVATMKGVAAAREATKTEDTYGKAAQPSGLCGSTSLGAGVQLSTRATGQVHRDMRTKQHEYTNDPEARPVDRLERLLDEEHPREDEFTDAIFPLEDTLTDEQVGKAQEVIKSLAQPRPAPVVTDGQKETPAGQTYAASRKVHEGRVGLAMDSLTNHVTYHAPTLPDDVVAWARKQWEDAGGSGEPVGIVKGKLSQAGLFKLLSQLRNGNPNWFNQITSANEAGLLREQVLMQATQLELTRRNNELLDRLMVLAALDFLVRMEGTAGKELDELYVRMVGAQQ